MIEVAGLLAEHRELEEQAARLQRIVTLEVADPAAVAAARWRMAQLLFDHCANEDRLVYDRLLASGDANATALAWSFRREHGALSPTFNQYIAEWPVARVAREWRAFQQATREVLQALAARIACEEVSLYTEAQRVLVRRAA